MVFSYIDSILATLTMLMIRKTRSSSIHELVLEARLGITWCLYFHTCIWVFLWISYSRTNTIVAQKHTLNYEHGNIIITFIIPSRAYFQQFLMSDLVRTLASPDCPRCITFSLLIFTNGDSNADSGDYGPKVSSEKPTYDSSDDDLLCDELDDKKPSYSTLASIATKQQKSLDKQLKTIEKHESLLIVKMEKNQILTNEHELYCQSVMNFTLVMRPFQQIMKGLRMSFSKGNMILRNWKSLMMIWENRMTIFSLSGPVLFKMNLLHLVWNALNVNRLMLHLNHQMLQIMLSLLL